MELEINQKEKLPQNQMEQPYINNEAVVDDVSSNIGYQYPV